MKQRLLIIGIQDNNIAVCLDRESHEVYRIRIDDKRLKNGMFILFESRLLANNDGVVSLNSEDFSLEDPKLNDFIKLTETNSYEIYSWIGFSPNPDHLTYDRRYGYTDWYGLVDCSGFEVSIHGIYGANIEVNDINFNGKTCLMRVCSPIRRQPNGNKEREKFSKKMEKFEEERLKSNLEERFSAGMDEESQMRAIVLFFDNSTNRAICFSKQLECLITVQLPLEIEAKRGQRIVFGDHDYSDDVYIPVFKPENIKFENEDTVRFEDGEILLSTAAGCSVQNIHPTYAKSLAYAGAFGHVLVDPAVAEAMERGTVYQCELSIYNFDFDNKKIPLFRISKVHQEMPEEDAEGFLFSLYKYETARSIPVEKAVNESSQSENVPMCSSFSSTNDNSEANDLGRLPVQSNSIAPSTASQSSSPSSDDQSEKNPAASDPSKPFFSSFGVQPQKTAVPSQDAVHQKPSFAPQGKEVEHCVLVLHVESGEIVGYETTLLKLMKLDVRNVQLPDISEFGTIRFTAAGFENGRAILKEGRFQYSDPSRNVIWKENGGQIPAEVVFSANRSHRTYNRCWGFSNYYGFIDVDDGSNENVDHSKVYSTHIAIKQWVNPLHPVFYSVSRLVDEHVPFSSDFAQSMHDFEARHSEEVQKNGLAQSYVPRAYGPPRNKFNKKPERKQYPSYYPGLLVSLKRNGRNFGRLWTQLGDAYFSEQPVHPDGSLAELYTWLSIRLQRTDGVRELLVTRVSDERIELCGTEVTEEGGHPVVRATITSSNRLNYQDNNLRYYRHHLLGIVQTETELEFDESHCATVKCRRRSEVRLRTEKGDSCYWYAEQVASPKNPNPVNPQAQKSCNPPNYPNSPGNGKKGCSDQFEESYEKGPNVPDNSSRYASSRDQSSIHDYERGFNVAPNNFQGSSSQQFYQNPSPPQSQYSTMHPQAFDRNSEFSFRSEPSGMDFRSNSGMEHPVNVGSALVVSRKKDLMLVYLINEKKSAFIQWKKFDKIRLGFQLVCRYVPVDPTHENLNASFEVIEILDILDGNYETIIDGDDSLAVFEVNMSQPMPGFSDYTRKSGNFVMYSNVVGPVLLDNQTRDVSCNLGSAATIVEEFRGKDGSSEMMAKCLFCRCLVPAKMNPQFYNDSRDIEAYVWKIVSITSTKNHYIWNQEDLKKKNLGPDFEEIEHQDEIHRQKKQALKEFEMRDRQSTASSVSGFMGDHSSNHRGWASNHDQYATPHGSVHNFGSSHSYHTAHGSQSGYQTSNYGGHPNQGRSDTPQSSDTIQDHRDFDTLLGPFRSIQSAVNVFINNPDVRNHMNAVSSYDLDRLEQSLAILAEIEARRRHPH